MALTLPTEQEKEGSPPLEGSGARIPAPQQVKEEGGGPGTSPWSVGQTKVASGEASQPHRARDGVISPSLSLPCQA